MKLQHLILILLSVLVFGKVSANPVKVIEHTVVKEETAWFLASVYFGHGEDYKKILATNHLEKPEQIKVGMVLKIEEPKFQPESENFKKHYSHMWELREQKLGHVEKTASVTVNDSKVEIPTAEIRKEDTVKELPFHEDKPYIRSALEHIE